jgi:hypothetical protein
MTRTRVTTLLAPVPDEPSTAERLYAAEVALHHARQTQVDEWIAAAYDRLHVAVEAYLRDSVAIAER